MGLLTPRNYHSKHAKNMMYPSTGSYFPFTMSSSIGGTPISYISAGTPLKNTNIFSVINRIASDVASAHFKTENSAALERLERPSRLTDRFSFWQGILLQLCLAGNAYVPITSGNLEHVPPSDVQINYLPGNRDIIYSINENNQRSAFKKCSKEMLHFKLMPDPDYRYLIGRSPLESLDDTLKVAGKSTEANLHSLDNQINASGKLTISNYLGDNYGEDLQDARDAFEEANTGKNSGRLMVLPEGFNYEGFEMKADVFKALNENASYSAAQISQAFGVPTDILGGGTSTESQHSNIEQIKATYLANLNTYVNPILEELKNKFSAPDLELDIKDMLDVDDAILIKQITDLRKAQAISSEQAQFMLIRAGFLPDSIPQYVPDAQATKGGEDNDDQDQRNDHE
ncbi:phage portal protein [Paucilactobacillus sp. N302-9]